MTDELTDELNSPPIDLAVEIRGMRKDFRGGFARLERERIGRRGTNRLAAVVIVGALLVAGFFAMSYVTQGRITCETRNNGRDDSRAMSVAVADNTVRELDRNGVVDREKLAASNERVALAKYPPVDC